MFGNMQTVTDPLGHVTTNGYDAVGQHKISTTDPDMGHWVYYYDSFGGLVGQTDAKGQSVSIAYDALGRMTDRTEADMTSHWDYDSAAHGVGMIAGLDLLRHGLRAGRL